MIVDELMPVLYKDYNISRDPDSTASAGQFRRIAALPWRGSVRTDSARC